VDSDERRVRGGGTATLAGLGTKWTTGPVNFDEGFAEAAGLPANEHVVGTVWFGTPAKMPTAPRKRLSVQDVLLRHD